MSSNIITSVRVRPFSIKEIQNKTTNVISMNGNETKIQLKDKSFKFNLDNCFWSHDGFDPKKTGYTEATNPKYTDQKKLYEKVGKPLLDNAWQGYNCSLFAYGQTGSGKTYSIMGYKENKGLVPLICENLFDRISKDGPNLKEGEKYQVTMGMLEIYNEKLRDLLSPKTSENMTVREEAGRGFYAPNQLMVPVTSYEAVLQKMEFGNKQRTIASTNMNETSSRAHTIVSLQFIQVRIDSTKKLSRKTSIINLIDLAGSEKISKSGAEGTRLTEAQNINKSLLTLGTCLNSLSTKQSHVPYRDSMLTKLLMNALGGNSKTALLVAVSPADTNFDESLSTLRFAERAKKVSTNAKINITENDAAMKKLAEENAELQRRLKELETKKRTDDESQMVEELKNQIERNKAEADAAALSWKEQVQQAKDELERQKKTEEQRKEKLNTTPHIFNLNDDPALNKLLVYAFEKPVTVVGNSKAQKEANTNIDIDLQGLNIMGKHAEIRNDVANKKTFIKPIDNAKILINGDPITGEYELKHHDRILFGNSLYFYHYDTNASAEKKTSLPEPTIELARQEITQKTNEYKTLDDQKLIDELSKVFQSVAEANLMAEELKKNVKYSLVIFGGNLPGYNNSSEPKVVVRVLLTSKQWEYFLDCDDFVDRCCGMQAMHNDIRDGTLKDVDKAAFDPFIPNESELCCIGFTHVLLTPIKHLLDLKDDLPITNNHAKEIGSTTFNCIPYDSNWKKVECTEKQITDGFSLFLKIFIDQIKLDKTLFKKVFYKFKFYDRIIKSPMSKIDKGVAKFVFEEKIEGLKTDASILTYLDQMLGIEIWGCYVDSDSASSAGAPGLTSTDTDVQEFLEKFKTMTEQRIKEGHTTIEISEIGKIVPPRMKESEPGWASKICVLQ